MSEGNWLTRIGNRVGQSVRDFGTRWAEHPIQSGISTMAGVINPLLGAAARYGFDQYNQAHAPDGLPGIISPNNAIYKKYHCNKYSAIHVKFFQLRGYRRVFPLPHQDIG